MNITKVGGAILVAACIGLAGCSSSSDDASSSPTPEPSFSSTDSPSDPLLINAQDFGTTWPFTVNSGTIHCQGKGAWFTSGGKSYPLNSVAETQQQDGTATVDKPQASLQVIVKKPGTKDPITGDVPEYMDTAPITGTGADMCGAT